MKIRLQPFRASVGRVLLAVAVVTGLSAPLAWTTGPALAATQQDIIGPPGSESFGASVTALPTGKIVVTDPLYDDGATEDVGAVYLYDGATGVLISKLTGSTAGDQVGVGGVTVLDNGNYLVGSPFWHGVGAVTWMDGTAGVNGEVSAANSLVGSTDSDYLGWGAMIPLSNGNYVVSSPYWDRDGMPDAGAVTWGNGTTGVAGAASVANSLVGSMGYDQVGAGGVTPLNNGNYVVGSPQWRNVGAATWGNGATGITGTVSAANSLIGSAADDQVGSHVTPLVNGNYVVSSPAWGNVGAATWGNGTTGIKGIVSATNSLVGGTAGDLVGWQVQSLSNDNYVVCSPSWENGAIWDAGAATWGDGSSGIAGLISAANSLVGTTAYDQVGSGGVTSLTNGNYVVLSPDWGNGATPGVGAATWGDGTTGIAGPLSAANSLIGSATGDHVGSGVTALTNGNYVVYSPRWSSGAITYAGAVTWASGATGIAGPVSTANSLVGSTAGDMVGSSVTALANGNYVVTSIDWSNGATTGAGAATWGDGTTGIAGPVSTTNSLVGSTAYDQVGAGGVAALGNGNYVVSSVHWYNGAISDVGAATWGNGATGIVGAVSAANSLVGSTSGDEVGSWAEPLSNGHYVVVSTCWDNGAAEDTGAVTWGSGITGVVGSITASNSVLGTTTAGGGSMAVAYDYVNNQLVVGRPADKIVTLFRPFTSIFLPVVLKEGA